MNYDDSTTPQTLASVSEVLCAGRGRERMSYALRDGGQPQAMEARFDVEA